jgi:C4-dicarboxylate-specific signal transduction histidine kinase
VVRANQGNEKLATAFDEVFRALRHEINQPLASILSNAQAAQHLLSFGKIDRVEVRQILQDISNQDKRISATLGQLQTLLKHNEAPLQRARIANVLRQVLRLARRDLLAHRIYVRTQLASGIPPVRFASLQLRQVLSLLIRCACDAMRVTRSPVHRLIEITAAASGDTARISIEAKGYGLDTEGLESVLHSFSESSRGEPRLEIAVCRLLVAAQHGNLWTTRKLDRSVGLHITVPILREKSNEHAKTHDLHRGRRLRC